MERKSTVYYNNVKSRYVNTTTLFIITLLITYGVTTYVCKAVDGVLWRSLYYNSIVTMLWLVSIIRKRPLALEFFLDVDEFNGGNRKEKSEFYYMDKVLPYLYGLTIFYGCCSCVKAIVWYIFIINNELVLYNLIFVSTDIICWILLALEVIATSFVICRIKNIEIKKSM